MNLETYPEPVRKLLEIGEPEDPWPDYPGRYNLTQADIPALIQLVADRDLRWEDASNEMLLEEDLPVYYAQIHAWRALGQLRAVEAIPALLDLLNQVDILNDDWLGEEAPDVFALTGPPAIAPLGVYLADQSHLEYARITASESLVKIAEQHPGTRLECIELLSAVLADAQQTDDALNGFIISNLVDLKAVDKIGLIEQAFQAGRVDESIMGDFEDVQVDMGLLEERITPKKRLWLAPPHPPKSRPARVSTRSEKKEKNKRKQSQKSRKKNRKKK